MLTESRAVETVNDLLAQLNRATAGITFLEEGRRVSYADLGDLVRGNAEHFARQGVTRDDRVAVAMENDLEHVVTLLALIATGAVPVSVKPRRGSAERHVEHLASLVDRFAIRFTYSTLPRACGEERLAWDPTARSTRRAAVVERQCEDVAFIQFSSGSLGHPKAVPIRHESVVHNLGSITAVDGRNPESIGYNFLPLAHDMGLVGGLLSNLLFQNPLFLSTMTSFLRQPTAFFSQCESCDVVGMPDFALRYIVRHLAARARPSDGRVLAGVRTIFCGAEPIRHTTIAGLVETAPRTGFDPTALVFCYGMAEATLMVTARRFTCLEDSFSDGPRGRSVANVGAPVVATEVATGQVGSDGLMVLCDQGAEGTLFVRGPGVFRGYLDGVPLGDDGWHDTGDVGFARNGEIYVSGRAKDVIIVNGENLFPGDIEEFVARLPGVGESVVMPDDDRFYVLLVARSGLHPGEVAGHIAAQFGAAPSGVVIGSPRDVLRTTSGKPMRQATLAELRSRGALD